MPRDSQVLLDDIKESLDRIETYTGGFKSEALDDPKTMDAVIRNLEVIGEAAKSLPDEVRGQYPVMYQK